MPVEYREEILDLRTITVPRTTLPRDTWIIHDHGKPLVPLSSVGFRHYGWISAETSRPGSEVEALARGWEFIRPILLQEASRLGKEGWELSEPLQPGLLSYKNSCTTPLRIFLWISFFMTLGFILLVLVPVFLILKPFDIRILRARLPLKRSID